MSSQSSYKGFIHYFGINDSYKCGYCGSMKPKNSSLGFWAQFLTADNYQNLIDRNWRRSGCYCYYNILDKMCCPTFAIRCDAVNFKISKSQKRVAKRFNSFIKDGTIPKYSLKRTNISGESNECSKIHPVLDTSVYKTNIRNIEEISHLSSIVHEVTKKKVTTEDSEMKTAPNSFDSSNYKCQIPISSNKKKYLRICKKISKIIKKNNCDEANAIKIMKEERAKKLEQNKKTFEDYFNERFENSAHKFEIRFVSTSNNEYASTFQESFEVYKKYQLTVHKDEPSECTEEQYTRFLINNPFKLSRFSNEKINIPSCYGSYHMQYLLDGSIIAVSVIDILSKSLSSVYLYYDPKYEFLSLGTYSALREILLIRQLNKINSCLEYFYLGLYIHSCPKMNYKARFSPSYLLCPKTYRFVPTEKCLTKIEKGKIPKFNDEDLPDHDGQPKDEDILIYFNSKLMTYAQYKRKFSRNKQIEEYATLVGVNCTRQIIFCSYGR